MNGCIYRTKDGECDLYAEGGKYTAFCEMENCAGRKMSNADRIRAMSDEELAEFMRPYDSGCPRWKENPLPCSDWDNCGECWLKWLKEEVSE